jgi:hypothetical protein
VGNVTVSAAGIQGPRGNTIWPTTGAPAASLGVDGDFAIDNTAFVLYGPRTAGVWGAGRSFGSAGALLAANNLSDLPSASTARTNLGLGGAATENVGTTAGTVAAGNDSRITGALQAANSLSDVANAGAARHNLLPWLFDVTAPAYGAKGDGLFVTDGAITSGQAILTSPSNGFGNVVAGQLAMVKGAGPTGQTTLVTTVASKQSSGQITLAANASTTVSGALVMIASDDTTAIQAAINAALTYAAAHGSAVVFVPTGSGLFYGVGGPLVTGGTTKGNAQLTLGAPVAATANKVCLTIEGVGNGSGLQHWQQTNPQLGGSTLVSFGVFANATAQTNSINAGGNACVIGGPAQPAGYGQAPGTFSNMLITLRNLSILTTHSAYGLTYSACDFSGIAEANLDHVAYGTTGTVAGNDYVSFSQFANGLSIGVLMPANGNNDNNHISNLSCHGGYTYALFATEHTVIDRLCILYCWSALCIVGSYFGSVGSVHGVNVVQASIEQCSNIVYIMGAGSNGIGPWLYATISTESGGPTFSGSSAVAMNAALGTVTLTGEFTVSGVNVTNPTGLKIVNGQSAYPVTAINSSSQTTYTVSVVDQTILVDTTTAAVTVTLISAAWTPNEYRLVNTGTHALTIATTGGQTINGASTLVLSSQWSKATLAPARPSGTWGWYQTA